MLDPMISPCTSDTPSWDVAAKEGRDDAQEYGASPPVSRCFTEYTVAETGSHGRMVRGGSSERAGWISSTALAVSGVPREQALVPTKVAVKVVAAGVVGVNVVRVPLVRLDFTVKWAGSVFKLITRSSLA